MGATAVLGRLVACKVDLTDQHIWLAASLQGRVRPFYCFVIALARIRLRGRAGWPPGADLATVVSRSNLRSMQR